MLDKFLEEINELKEAKALLDDILRGYSVYEKTFNFNDTTKFPDPDLESKLDMKRLVMLNTLGKLMLKF